LKWMVECGKKEGECPAIPTPRPPPQRQRQPESPQQFQHTTQHSLLEGTSVILSYKYPKLSTGDYFFWYQQFPGKPLEFMISHSSSGAKGNDKVNRLKIQVENKQIDLQITSAAVTDSAVYYCAVEPTVTGNNTTMYNI
uniref:Immunoglobulin V-set domain-containing protein n=1 Tax=Oryzias latipes TaxID=8090 RepID=A0A3P9HUZ6_ORYLA